MPRLVDYACRFEFLRRAAFAIVLQRTVGDLSRHAIARELGTSISTVRRVLAADASLTRLAAEEVTRRRRIGRWGLPSKSSGTAEQVALELLRRLLPEEAHRVAEELVWWRLVLARPASRWILDDPRPGNDSEGRGSLREEFEIATRGYTDAPAAEPRADEEGDPLEHEVVQHEANVRALIDRALETLETREEQDFEAIRTRALVDGLNLAVCLGRMTPEEAVAALARHLGTVRVAT